MPDTQSALFHLRPRRLSRRRREAILEHLATELDRVMAEQRVTQDMLHRRSQLAEGTVSNILRARNTRVSSVVDAFQALGYRLVIDVQRIEQENR